jgi:hypothetical protein
LLLRSSAGPADAAGLQAAGVQDLVLEALGLLVAEAAEGSGVVRGRAECVGGEISTLDVTQCAAHGVEFRLRLFDGSPQALECAPCLA